MSKKLVEKPNLQGRDPTQAFYMALSAGYLDGSLDEIGGQGCEGLFESEAEAIETLVDLNQSYPTLEGYVYHCVPIKRIWRGDTRVGPVPKMFSPQRRRRRQENPDADTV